MAERICKACNKDVADALFMRGGICFGCWLDSFIPPNYQRREHYAYDPVWGQLNATRRAPLGVPFLDAKGSKVCDILRLTKQRPRF